MGSIPTDTKSGLLSDVYAGIVEGLSAGVVAVSRNGEVLAANEAACDHLNFTAKDLAPGALFTRLSGMERFRPMIEEVCDTGRPMTREEVTLGEHGTSRKEIGVSVSPLELPDGSHGAVLLFNNMTERRRRERTMALNRQLVDLGDLAAGVVHQVRNPLTIITGRAELMLRQAKDEREREYLESIISEANQIAVSLSTFLQCAKPFEFRPRLCEAQSVVDRALQQCREQSEQKGIEIECGSSDGLDVLHVDPERVSEALLNLLRNALDVTGDGGRVRVEIRQDEMMTTFAVTDDGEGVQAGEHDDIYSPFYTQKRDGTGLGLSISQRIATLQGGTARHRNLAEGGAQFEIEIPTQQGRPE